MIAVFQAIFLCVFCNTFALKQWPFTRCLSAKVRFPRKVPRLIANSRIPWRMFCADSATTYPSPSCPPHGNGRQDDSFLPNRETAIELRLGEEKVRKKDEFPVQLQPSNEYMPMHSIIPGDLLILWIYFFFFIVVELRSFLIER